MEIKAECFVYGVLNYRHLSPQRSVSGVISPINSSNSYFKHAQTYFNYILRTVGACSAGSR